MIFPYEHLKKPCGSRLSTAAWVGVLAAGTIVTAVPLVRLEDLAVATPAVATGKCIESVSLGLNMVGYYIL